MVSRDHVFAHSELDVAGLGEREQEECREKAVLVAADFLMCLEDTVAMADASETVARHESIARNAGDGWQIARRDVVE